MINRDNSSMSKGNILLALQFLSDFGDQITAALLAISIVDIAKSTHQVGLVYFFNTMGYIAFTIFGGWIGDKLCRRKILFFSDVGRGLVVLLMIVALSYQSVILIYMTSFLLASLGSIQRPARIAVWAESIPSQYLERYNGWSECFIQTSTIAGPLIASFFIVNNSIGLGFSIDALSFFICAIVFAQIIKKQDQMPAPAIVSNKQNLLHSFTLIKQNNDLWRYISYDALQMIAFGAFNATFLLLAQRDFLWTKVEFSYHLSIIAVFSCFGAIFGTSRIISAIDLKAKLIICACICSSMLWVVLYAETFPLTSFFFGMANAVSVSTVTATRTKIQLLAKTIYPQHLSSIIASRSVIIRVATLFGISAVLFISEFISLKLSLAVLVTPVILSVFSLIDRREIVIFLNRWSKRWTADSK